MGSQVSLDDVRLVFSPVKSLAINQDEKLFAVNECQNSGAVIVLVNAKSHVLGRCVGNKFDTLTFT
jgi:hypothetical protein